MVHRRICPTCDRPLDGPEVIERDGLELVYGIGISYKGLSLKLRKGSQQILRLLMTQRFVSRARLMDEIYREETPATSKSLDVQLTHLRKSLRLIEAPFQIVVTHGMGWSLVKHVF